MPAFDASTLAAWSGGRWHGPALGGPARGFAIDSRRVRPGEIFVALATDRRDGHEFLRAAKAAGAAAALVERPAAALDLPQLVVADPLRAFQRIAREHRRRFEGVVIAVTGSAGKTSTKELLALLLGPGVAATEGNLNNHLGVPLTLTGLEPGRHKFAVVEAGISAKGEMRVLAEMIEPDAAIITLIAPAHLEELGSVDGVAAEKSLLAAAVRPGGVAVFPRSCLGYGVFRDLSVRQLPPDFALRPRGGAVDVILGGADGGAELFTVPVPSEGMAQNAVLALRLAMHYGVPRNELHERLAGWRPAAQRGEVRQEGGRLVYLDHYNANPASMLDALSAFERIAPPGEPRLFLVGCMEELGAEAERYHRELGAALPLAPADRAIVVGGWAAAVRAGAVQRGADPARVQTVESAAAAAPLAARFTGAIFVKGSRRHRMEEALAPTAAPC